MDDTSKTRDLSGFTVGDREMVIAEKPAVPMDVNEYRLELLRHSNENDSEEVVRSVLDRTEGLINQYSSLAMQALQQLGAFPDGAVPDSNIRLAWPAVPSLASLDVDKPGKPQYQTPNPGEAPSLRGDIQDITTSQLTRPNTALPDAPSDKLEWEEDEYISPLFLKLKASVSNIIIEGGTGLSADWEDAVWTRAQSREQLQHEQRYHDAERYFAAKGRYGIPGGQVARLKSLDRERTRNLELLNSEVIKNQYELARQHGQFMLDLGRQLETLSIDDKNKIKDRALDAAKSVITLLYENYKTVIEGIRIKAGIYETEVRADGLRVEAIASRNKSITDTYSAEMDGWVKRLNAEFSLVEQVIRMYIAELGGYEAEVRAEATKLSAIIERYKAEMEGVTAQGQISLGEYEQLVKAILGQIELKLGNTREAGKLAAQIAASALSAFNASASISDNSSRSRSYSEGKSISTSNSFSQAISNSLGISTSLSESASDSYAESKSLNYTFKVGD
ncbi:MAG: hypothetical protein KQH59_20430 [Desulfobulbaceae bacterium]|nr:hypothetical protein [Desulfobulbaceae bacterium]